MTRSLTALLHLAALAAVAAPAGAAAQTLPAPPSDAAPGAQTPADAPFGSAAIVDTELGAIAGREDIAQTATATQTAGVSRNSVGDNSVTGDARVSDSAFQNLSGLSLLTVNTGNNVAINSAMNVNITISPPR